MIHRLSNGLAVAAEQMPGTVSTSFVLLAQGGAMCDPLGLSGRAAVLAEMLGRGAAEMDSRELVARLDSLGIDRSFDSSAEFLSLSGSLLPKHLPEAFSLFTLIAASPRFDDIELAQSVELCRQSVIAIEDNPSEKIMVELAKKFYPAPLGNYVKGVAAEIETVTADDLRAAAAALDPAGAILAVSGNIDPRAVHELAETAFGTWRADAAPRLPDISMPQPATEHLPKDSGAQVQIGIAAPYIPADSPDFPKAALLMKILSGGMSSRLFVEVREKRGLVYSVRAYCTAVRNVSAIYVYAGTTPDRAAECIAVINDELARLAKGVTAEELERAKIKYRSSLIMSCELPGSRASSMALDYFRYGRIRRVPEMIDAIARISLDEMNAFVAENPVAPRVTLTLGPAWQGAPR